jgi:hypothetical protein
MINYRSVHALNFFLFTNCSNLKRLSFWPKESCFISGKLIYSLVYLKTVGNVVSMKADFLISLF